MNTRRSYDYAKPTTLIAIITDAFESVSPKAGPLSVTYLDTKTIISDAWAALVANAGQDEAVEMAMNAGINLDDLEERIYNRY